MNPIPKAFVLLATLAMAFEAGCAPGRIVPPATSIAMSEKPRNLSPSAGSDALKALIDGNSAFAFALYQVLRTEDGNLFLSPYSISVALAMTSAGASGNTAREMADTLRFTLPQAELHPAFNAYSLDLEARADAVTEGTPFELSIANSLWGQQGFPFQSEFLDILAENYSAGMRLVDFIQAPETARRAVNDWVSDETRAKIKDLIPEGAIDTLTRLVLANAIYFKAAWRNAFDSSGTIPAPFHRLDGSLVDVPMMHESELLGYAAGEGVQALELPYENGNMSMVILLPDEGQFERFEGALSLAGVQRTLADMTYRPVILGLPKFSYESSFSLSDALKTLGMADAFDPEKADFSGMDGRRDLYITDVIHKAFIDVDEEGTEAAAATAVIVGTTSAPADEPVTVTIDRPFVYLIRDNQTGAILFLGRVLDPLQ
jgi:serpin B